VALPPANGTRGDGPRVRTRETRKLHVGVLGGKLLSMVSVVVVAAEGPTGAATVVRVIRNEQMKRAAELVVSRLKLSGFYGLDFVIATANEVPYLIEMNPRCTQLGHIEFAGAGCLAGVLSAVLRARLRLPFRIHIERQDCAISAGARSGRGVPPLHRCKLSRRAF